MGLGGHPDIGLAKVREIAAEKRELIAQGIDPLEEKKCYKPAPITFKQAAELLIKSKAPGWRSSKHGDQWRSTLAAYAYPKFGDRPVATIDTPDVLAALQEPWLRIPETASRVRQRIEATLSYAAAIGARSGENPARWKGHLDHLLPKPSKVRAVEHFAAMDWREIPQFWPLLCELPGVAALALRFAILTAARSGEVRLSTWDEIHTEAALWVISGSRMKGGREHRQPLNQPALRLLASFPRAFPVIFPSPRGRPLSDMALTQLLRRMENRCGKVTAHGFRASFRMWAGEATSHPREVIEHALAHKLPDKVEAAYARSDLLEKRRKLLTDWGHFVTAGSSYA